MLSASIESIDIGKSKLFCSTRVPVITTGALIIMMLIALSSSAIAGNAKLNKPAKIKLALYAEHGKKYYYSFINTLKSLKGDLALTIRIISTVYHSNLHERVSV